MASPRQRRTSERETPIHCSSSHISAESRAAAGRRRRVKISRPSTPHHRQHNLAEIRAFGSPLHAQIRISVEWNTHTQNRPQSARNAAGSGMWALHTTESSTTPSLAPRARAWRGADKQDGLAPEGCQTGTMLRIVRTTSAHNDSSSRPSRYRT